MDCREFRDKHSLLVDIRCSAFDENEMRRHMLECPKCARHDALVRRSQLLVRNLPTIEPSPDFQARLDARLRAASALVMSAEPRPRTTFGSFLAVAAGVAFAAYVAADMLSRAGPEDVNMPPVVATMPEMEDGPSPSATSALVATVPTGMSVWPAIMLASQAPMHFVAAELATER